MNIVKFMLSSVILATLAISSCQGSSVMTDTAPLGEGVMRLGDTEVAQVDGTKIYLSDVERAAASQGLIEVGAPLTPEQPVFKKMLDELIDQRLMALGALQQSLDQEDESRRRLSVARERILGNILVENYLKDKVNEVTIRRMYDEQADLRDRGEEVQARHILLKDIKIAEQVAKQLKDGADFAVLAKEMSEDEGSRENGGNLGFFTADMLDKKFTEVAFQTQKDEISMPFQTQYGWHILQVQNRRKAAQPSFEDMRSEILNFMTYDEIQNLLKSLRAQGDVKLLFEQPAVKNNIADETALEAPKDE